MSAEHFAEILMNQSMANKVVGHRHVATIFWCEPMAYEDDFTSVYRDRDSGEWLLRDVDPANGTSPLEPVYVPLPPAAELVAMLDRRHRQARARWCCTGDRHCQLGKEVEVERDALLAAVGYA